MRSLLACLLGGVLGALTIVGPAAAAELADPRGIGTCRHAPSAKLERMSDRTDTEVEEALARDRRHLGEWRSTPEGEADYQATVERVRKLDEQLRADR